MPWSGEVLDEVWTEVIGDAVRVTVTRVCPEERPLVDEVIESRCRGTRLRVDPVAGPVRGVGFGVELLMQTQILVDIGVQAVAQAGGLAVVSGGAWGLRRWRRRGTPEREALPDDWADRLRESARRHGEAFEIDPAVVDLLADALVGGTAHPDREGR
ncbi:MAG: hypothetical protein ACRCYU_23425 [Nocardioides sp.]